MGDEQKAEGLTDAAKAGYEKRISELTQRAKEAEARATLLESEKTSITTTHEQTLANLQQQLQDIQAKHAGAQREVAYVSHGIMDADARQFAEFSYHQLPEESRPGYGEYLASLVASPPPWLKGYLQPQTAAEAPPAEPGAEPEATAEPATAKPAEATPPPPPPNMPTTQVAPPIAADAGAAPVGVGGLRDSDIANASPQMYAEIRSKLLGKSG